MSASTVSVTANTTSTRRRAVEKKQPIAGLELAADSTQMVATTTSPITPDTNTNNSSARLNAGGTSTGIHKDVIQVRKPPPNTTSGDQTTTRRIGASRKPVKAEKPRWLTAISIITKNFALLFALLGFVQLIRWAVLKDSGLDAEGISAMSGDVDGKFAEMGKFLKKSLNAMQVQVEAIDRKYEKGISSIKKEFDEKLNNQGEKMDLKLKELDGRSELFEKFIGEFESKSLLSKEEFSDFFEEFRKSKTNGNGHGDELSLDQIREYARNVVEKEIQRHAADGLGMVDYALASGGGMVVRHSEPFGKVTGTGSWLTNRNKVHADAAKMLRPSFGEPGQCFPLKGSSGFVQIKLRTAIIPEAVTLEHVAKSVAYDRSSAPKHCRVSGWLQGQDLTNSVIETEKMFLLTEFTYDLDKSSAQTFNVRDSSEASPVVDTIRLDFTSNHGSAYHTCIYRLRVHGHEPNSVSMMGIRS